MSFFDPMHDLKVEQRMKTLETKLRALEMDAMRYKESNKKTFEKINGLLKECIRRIEAWTK